MYPPVLEDHALLYSLVDLFQLFNVGLEGIYALFIVTKSQQLILQ
jgi:hypothetical protein